MGYGTIGNDGSYIPRRQKPKKRPTTLVDVIVFIAFVAWVVFMLKGGLGS